jgi:hypothetical protein
MKFCGITTHSYNVRKMSIKLSTVGLNKLVRIEPPIPPQQFRRMALRKGIVTLPLTFHDHLEVAETRIFLDPSCQGATVRDLHFQIISNALKNTNFRIVDNETGEEIVADQP